MAVVRWGISGLASVAALLASVTGQAAPTAVEHVRIWSGPDSTRVVFEVGSTVEHRVFALAEPDRIVIDLPNATAAESLALAEATGLVTAFRAGGRPNGDLRLVLELSGPAKAKTFVLEPNAQYGHRLVVDLFPPERPAVVRRAAELAPTSGRDLVIAIDAGHGGEDPGAIGRGGGREKDVVLAIARKLKVEIDAQPGMSAVLIRGSDYFISLRKRIELAHTANADLFVSIHADSYRDRDAQGATIYVLSEKGATDEAAALLAQRENASDLIGGVSLADKDPVLAHVLLDLSQSAALSLSVAAGERFIARLSAVTPMRKTSVQQAQFAVLKAPDIPSILIETAYISNPREESLLRSSAHQAKLARALREGIVDYFEVNPPPGSYFAEQRDRAPSEAGRHIIARGETLSTIAERYRISLASLLRSNRLRGNDVIRIGQVLTIPRG